MAATGTDLLVPSEVVEEFQTALEKEAQAYAKALEREALKDTRALGGPGTAAAKRTAVHDVADAHVKSVAVTFRHAFAKGREALGSLQTEADADRAASAIQKALQQTLLPTLLDCVADSGEAGLDILKQKLRVAELRTAAKLPKVKHSFNRTSPHVLKWAKKHTAELIDNVSDVSRRRIKAAIVEAIKEGNLKEAAAKIAAEVGDDERARQIAHHETMLAASEGQRASWRQAVEEELLAGNERRSWIFTEDGKACEICENLEGKTAKLDGEYPDEGGDGPPQHVGCRCTEGLVI